eukprot:TRINITY_DN25508_c0_g1_i1.p1 TRINITY_DN25508_c0_g1~~TRINITY_DN25508_c0_g1_i1.p1  ORF type:complete len:631 (+),score=200.52 TRINITY_DN25508_c0_g1_i1:72-1964(+)
MPGYGYGDAREGRNKKRQRSESSGSSSRSQKRAKDKGDKDKDAKKQKRRKKNRSGREKEDDKKADRPGSVQAASKTAAADKASPRDPPPAAKAKAAGDAGKNRGSWREDKAKKVAEEEEDDEPPAEGFTQEDDDDEAMERKLAESRARREALIAKWVNRGEGQDGGGGGLEMPNTSTSLDDKGEGSESDGEVAKFFEEKAKAMGAEDDSKDPNKLEESKALTRFILAQRAEHDGDMFGDEDDDAKALNKKTVSAASISQTGASAHDWNDAEGYYRAQIGEVMDGRYKVVEDKCGQGVFSNVVKAKDAVTGQMVAIKIMRTNDMMRKAAEKEIELLKLLNRTDKGNKKNVIRLMKEFDYRDHLCLVFECMWDNLRMALKKYTKDKGMSMRAVRAYTKQLVVALHHVHRCDIIHADIKPDNILISAGHNLVKICDLGSAMYTREMEQTPYLVSRFYRAPEICIGAKYGPPSDTWAMGCSLFEIFTGKILFRGKSNNDMIKCFMEVKGKLPHKMIKTGMCWKQHFDDNLDFKYIDSDKVTRKKILKTITDCSAKKNIAEMVLQRVGPEKQKSENKDDQLYVKKAKQFADLIEKMTTLDPERRATPEDLLKHAFINEPWPAPAAAPNGAEKGGK